MSRNRRHAASLRPLLWLTLISVVVLVSACRTGDIKQVSGSSSSLAGYRSAQLIMGTKIAGPWEDVVELRDEILEELEDRGLFESVEVLEERRAVPECLCIQVWLSHGTVVDPLSQENVFADVRFSDAASGEHLGEYEVEAYSIDPIVIGGALGKAAVTVVDLIERERRR